MLWIEKDEEGSGCDLFYGSVLSLYEIVFFLNLPRSEIHALCHAKPVSYVVFIILFNSDK
jgi:hypothetical protein